MKAPQFPSTLPEGSILLKCNVGELLFIEKSNFTPRLLKYQDHDIGVEYFMRKYSDHLFPFFDLGASVGLFTVLAAQIGPGEVFAFEPDPENVALLRINLQATHNEHVRVWPVACAAHDGTVELGKIPCGLGCFADGPRFSIPARSLRSVIEETGVFPAFAKLDIEGGELDALEGFVGAERSEDCILELEFSWHELGAQVGRLLDMRPPEKFDYEFILGHHEAPFMSATSRERLKTIRSSRSIRPMERLTWFPPSLDEAWAVLAASSDEMQTRRWEICITPKSLTRD